MSKKSPTIAEEDLSQEEISALRVVAKTLLAERSVERAFMGRQLLSLKRKHASEKRKREEAYTTVAKLRSAIANLRLKIKGISPCTRAT